MKTSLKPFHPQTGFSMIEVLVTLVILLVGLLGLAGMMMQSQRSEMESYQRVQALVLLQDMVGRINANRKAARCYAITTATNGSPYLGSSSTISTPVCATPGSSTPDQQARAVQDMIDWNNLLLGTTETTTSGTTTNIGAMIGARGCVSYDTTTDIYLVSVAWQGMGKTAAPPAAWNCATSQYGTETDGLRRVVGLTLKIAKLD